MRPLFERAKFVQCSILSCLRDVPKLREIKGSGGPRRASIILGIWRSPVMRHQVKREKSTVRTFIIASTAAATRIASAAFTQEASQGIASIPDFSGVWSHPALSWFEPLPSGPRPVTNRSRKNSVSNYDELVGDYTNPILQPWAAEVVKKFGEISLAGVTYPNPANQCWPEPVPFIFKHNRMQMLQQPDQIIIL